MKFIKLSNDRYINMEHVTHIDFFPALDLTHLNQPEECRLYFRGLQMPFEVVRGADDVAALRLWLDDRSRDLIADLAADRAADRLIQGEAA